MLDKLAKSLVAELHFAQNRYFTYHIPKSDNIKSGQIYIHEPVLMHLSPRKPNMKRGSTVGLYVGIEKGAISYNLYLGFQIVHSKFLALNFSTNLQTDPEGLKRLSKLVKRIEPLYGKEQAWTYYSSNEKYSSCKKKKIKPEDELKDNFCINDLDKLPKDFLIRNKPNCGFGGGVAPFGGCYFSVSEFYRTYNRARDIVNDTSALSRYLWKNYGFLHNMLLPSTVSKRRNTDQWRLLNGWFKTNGIEKRCEVSGCSSRQESLEVHHIKPVSLGGKDEISNMVSLCREHHSKCDHNSIGRVDENCCLIQGDIKLKLLKSAVKRIKVK